MMDNAIDQIKGNINKLLGVKKVFVYASSPMSRPAVNMQTSFGALSFNKTMDIDEAYLTITKMAEEIAQLYEKDLTPFDRGKEIEKIFDKYGVVLVPVNLLAQYKLLLSIILSPFLLPFNSLIEKAKRNNPYSTSMYETVGAAFKAIADTSKGFIKEEEPSY
jgi:hypothetical protein